MLLGARLRGSFPFLRGASAAGLNRAWNIRDESFEDGTRTPLEHAKSVGAFGTAHWITAFVEYRDFVQANQKIPFAPDAVIDSGFSMKE